MNASTISAAEFRHLLESGQHLNVIDVRTPAEFARVHVRGARLVPLDELDARIAEKDFDAQEPIYILCQAGGRAAKACDRLRAAGIKSAWSVEGGTAACERLGMDVERGPGGSISLERQVRIAAGTLVLVGTILAWAVHPLLWVIPAFVGAGLIFAGITDYCGMGLLLAKMPWNRSACNR